MREFRLNRTSAEDFNSSKMTAMTEDMYRVLKKPVYGNEEAWQLYVREVAAFQYGDGGFPLLDTYQLEADIRVEYCHKPTYLCTAILMKALVEEPALLTGKEDIILPRALKMCCARNLTGHGYDDMKGQLEAMEIFFRAHVRQFLERYPDFCPEFTEMIHGIIEHYRQFIEAERYVFGFGENYEQKIKEIVSGYEKNYVFVYGTLMEGQSNYQAYLYPARPLTSGTIEGFEMHDLGSFPGIVQGNEKVKGELFVVSSAKLVDLDRLEGNGSLYNRIWTEVYTDEGKTVPAYVYIYNGAADGLRKITYDQQPYRCAEEELDMAGKDVFAHVISYIVKEEPESADDLLYAFELVKSRYEDTERKIRNSIHLSVDSGDYNTLREQTAYCEEIQGLISEVDAYLEVIVNNLPEGRRENTAEELPSEPLTERERINYGLYATDRMEEHSLTENFEHTRPCAFSFKGNIRDANSWQDILVQICGILAEKDLEKMKSLTTAESMQGRKLKYITYQEVPRKTKRIPGTDLYVWINNSANTIAQLIVRLLKEYDMNESVVKVYLRADYSPLHQ